MMETATVVCHPLHEPPGKQRPGISLIMLTMIGIARYNNKTTTVFL